MGDRKINILVILEINPFVDSNAANNRFLTLADGLALLGCNIDLLFIRGFDSKSEKLKFNESGTFNNLNYRYLIPIYFSNLIIRKIFNRIFPLKYTKRLIYKIIKSNNYDFVWFGVSAKIIEIGIYLFKCKLKTQYFHERSEYSWISLSDNNIIHKKYIKVFLPQLDILAVMTSTLLQHYKKYIGNKTKIIHLPMTVDFARFINQKKDNNLIKPYIAYCGNINNAKDGVDILLKAFIKIMNSFPDMHLYLAGPKTPEEDYIINESIISENYADKRITFLGSISREEIPTFLSNATILAMARPKSKQAEGGFPTKLGEYLATGNPVCTTSVGEIGYYLKDKESAFLAEPGSIDTFADALKKALICKKASSIGVAGRNVALEHFNKETQASLLYNFLIQNRHQ